MKAENATTTAFEEIERIQLRGDLIIKSDR